MNTPQQRKQIFVEKEIQGAIVRRVLIYWMCCLLFVTVPILIGRTFSNPDQLFFEQFDVVWERYWPVFVASFLMLPFVVWDVLRFSHRCVGPLVRLRRDMGLMADGESVKPRAFRKGDYWQDLGDSYCRIADRLNALNSADAASESSEMRELERAGSER